MAYTYVFFTTHASLLFHRDTHSYFFNKTTHSMQHITLNSSQHIPIPKKTSLIFFLHGMHSHTFISTPSYTKTQKQQHKLHNTQHSYTSSLSLSLLSYLKHPPTHINYIYTLSYVKTNLHP
jgi:hypothetical protein